MSSLHEPANVSVRGAWFLLAFVAEPLGVRRDLKFGFRGDKRLDFVPVFLVNPNRLHKLYVVGGLPLAVILFVFRPEFLSEAGPLFLA